MKKLIRIFVLALVVAVMGSCSITRKVEKDAYPIAFTEVHNYYVKNNFTPKKLVRKVINTEGEFRAIFGDAAVMGANGRPTPINFGRQFVLAVVSPVTDTNTQMYPLSVLQNGNAIIFNYKVDKGGKMSYSVSPYVAVVLDRPVNNSAFEIYWNEK
ncbi:MAG: hypothetical protein MJZ63_00540 [Muribaculaceae bacterium]|nr:hypothetical protein [Muribaculaceae bacterium]